VDGSYDGDDITEVRGVYATQAQAELVALYEAQRFRSGAAASDWHQPSTPGSGETWQLTYAPGRRFVLQRCFVQGHPSA
jgi:hypothetical protein